MHIRRAVYERSIASSMALQYGCEKLPALRQNARWQALAVASWATLPACHAACCRCNDVGALVNKRLYQYLCACVCLCVCGCAQIWQA